MKRFYGFLLFLFLNNSTSVVAQVTLIAPLRTVRSGDSVTVNLVVSTKDTLTTLQFTFGWNPTVLSFGRLDTIAGFPPTSDGDEFGTATVANGRLTYLWTARPTVSHRPFPDSLVFRIVFRAIGAHGTNSALQFSGSPTAMRASNPRLTTIPVLGVEGRVLIGNVATKEVNTEGVVLMDNAPNPFDNQTVVRFKLTGAEDVTIRIFDLQGRLVHSQKGFFTAGEHQLRLDTEGVFPKGYYQLSLQTAQHILTKNIIKF
jgi:hypothetical protein